MVAALERGLTTNARVTLLTLLPVPPLDGFRIICWWLPDEVEIAAHQLGWMPIVVLYFLPSQSPLGDTVWSVGERVSEVLQIPVWLAEYGLYQLKL